MNKPSFADNIQRWVHPKALYFLLEPWRRLTWRHIAWTAVAGALIAPLMLTVTHAFEFFLGGTWSERLAFIIEFLAFSELEAFTFLLCVIAADHAVWRGAHRVRAYGLALFMGAALNATFDWSIRNYVMDWFSKPDVDPGWVPVHAASTFLYALLLGGFATFVYADWQRARDSAGRLHAAGLARTRAARDILQTRLQAMQARVDPQLLFDTLARTRQRYDVSPILGEQTLDNLIAYLRIAMPRLLATSSTLAREIDLARAYAAIVADCGDRKVAFAIDRNEDGAHIPFPSMLLLPLVEHAVSCGRHAPSDENAISIRAHVAGTNLQVTVGHGGSAFSTAAGSESINRVRERLHELFEGRARLELRGRPDRGTEAVMEIPDERA